MIFSKIYFKRNKIRIFSSLFRVQRDRLRLCFRRSNVCVRQKGMTLIEMLVTLGIFVFIMLAITYSLVSFYRYNSYAMEQSGAIDSARRGINPTINNIREATYSEEGAYPIISAGTDSFSFYSNINNNNNIEKVRLFLVSGTFKKGVIEPAGDPPTYNGQSEKIYILSDNVRNTYDSVNIFRYYDNTGAEITNTTNVSNIAFIKMSVIININPARSPNDFTLDASAALRNLKTNL